MFIGCAILSAVMEGGGGIVAVALETTVGADDLTLEVASTSGFLDADYVIIGSEKILYTSISAGGGTEFTVHADGRGYDGTEAVAHVAGAMIYTAEASAINNALGFNIAATADTMGLWSTITIPFFFLTKTLPRIVMMNYSFLSGQLAIIGWFFFAAAAGLIITLALYLAGGRRV